MATIISSSAKSAKSLAKQVAKQMAREPLEVLRAAGTQVGAGERMPPTPPAPGVSSPKEPSPQDKARIEAQGQRQLAALEAEIKDIQKSREQEAAVKIQQEQAVAAQSQAQEKEPPKVPSRPSRRLFGIGQKAQAEKQKTRVEKPLPPSG
jgi:hypothetical protein